MSPTYHVLVSAAAAAATAHWTQSPEAGIGCFLSGIFIDVDHHIEYFLDKKKFPVDYQDLVKFCSHHQNGKLFLFFHSYESLLLLWFMIYIGQLGVIWSGVALGLTLHLVCDQFTNPLKPLSYFLSYRIFCNFERKQLFSERHKNKNV